MSDQRWTITTAAEAIRAGSLTPVDLVEHCLKQIDRYEEKVRAWVVIDRNGARDAAERLTAELKQGGRRGPLHGIPIGVKDIFDVFDMPTAAGSKLWANSVARQDSDVVAKLRKAGAIILGKTVTTAYASFDPPITRNPWNLDRTPGGSSSGSAAAVATGMCLGAIGSQTGGSVTRPAAFCGVCGIKPTYDRVSLEGVLPLAPKLDHAGFMAPCAADLAVLLQAGSRHFISNGDIAFTTVCEPTNMKGGRLHDFFDERAEPGMLRALNQTCDRLSKAGLKIVRIPAPTGFAEITRRHQTIMAVEAATFHERRLRDHPEDYPPRVRSLIDEGLATPAPEYQRALNLQNAFFVASWTNWDDEIDVLITPATLGPAPDASTTGSPVFNSPWSFIGLPTVNIPIAWTDDGLPLAMQLVGRRYGEAAVLQMAAWCEKVIGFQHRTPDYS